MSRRRAVILSALLITAAVAACDVKHTQHDQKTVGPAITIVGTNFGPNATIPADGVIQIAFDRYLLPSTITRQSFVILDSANKPLGGLPLKAVYDPVARTVTIIGPDGPGKPWLTVDQSYKLVLPIPTAKDSDLGGFRAIDRATLHDSQKREFVFRAGPPEQKLLYEPAVDFCADVMPIFQSKCSSPDCHGAGTGAAASLILDSVEGVRVTAKGRVAQGANTSSRSFSPEGAGKVFGVNMALIEPNDPGSSWLMYKIELAPPPVVDAGGRPNILCTPEAVGAPSIPAPTPDFFPLAPAQTAADDIERSILNDYVLGRQMPYPSTDSTYFSQPLTFQERERMRVWIARGAEIRECGGCAEYDPPDAGAGAADASDQ